ncbi:hypothetical protein ACFWPQ_01975 [Streptomyces sp. NPDC058464]|uniref:hypothetical protein n=1 Tax=Streptomyces sp. NPDC058464 TaxID=3346511 RepID=UPI003653A6F7
MTCPNAAQHTPHPRRQFAHAAWAEEMIRTHRQQRCTGCGLFEIWMPRPDAPDLPPVAYRVDHKQCGCCDGDQPGCTCRYHRHLETPV